MEYKTTVEGVLTELHAQILNIVRRTKRSNYFAIPGGDIANYKSSVVSMKAVGLMHVGL